MDIEIEPDIGVTAVMLPLRRIRQLAGTDAALEAAEQMIIAAASVIAHERGADYARHVLDGTADVLPLRGDGGVH